MLRKHCKRLVNRKLQTKHVVLAIYFTKSLLTPKTKNKELPLRQFLFCYYLRLCVRSFPAQLREWWCIVTKVFAPITNACQHGINKLFFKHFPWLVGLFLLVLVALFVAPASTVKAESFVMSVKVVGIAKEIYAVEAFFAHDLTESALVISTR